MVYEIKADKLKSYYGVDDLLMFNESSLIGDHEVRYMYFEMPGGEYFDSPTSILESVQVNPLTLQERCYKKFFKIRHDLNNLKTLESLYHYREVHQFLISKDKHFNSLRVGFK